MLKKQTTSEHKNGYYYEKDRKAFSGFSGVEIGLWPFSSESKIKREIDRYELNNKEGIENGC